MNEQFKAERDRLCDLLYQVDETLIYFEKTSSYIFLKEMKDRLTKFIDEHEKGYEIQEQYEHDVWIERNRIR